MRTRERFDRVSELVEGFESPFGMELLATVHWLFQHDDTATEPVRMRVAAHLRLESTQAAVHAASDRDRVE
jgi:hypothetical protein